MKERAFRLGCDIGGTFTDFVLVNDETGVFSIYKCLTTPSDPSDAVETGIRGLQEQTPGFVPEVAEFIHGTTLVINAIIERKGARTGLITTKGFRDVLELGREMRYDAYDIFAEYPLPLVPRALRVEVDERIASDGRILRPLDIDQAKQALRYLLDAGVESVAICLINSYENPVHEAKIKALVNELAPELSVSASYEVLPQIREYERTSTTATNAYVKPITVKYLQKLSSRLQSLGFDGKLFIMLSSGSITTVATACEFPVRIIESGPTAAVIASQHYGRMFDIKGYLLLRHGRNHRQIVPHSKRRGRIGFNLRSGPRAAFQERQRIAHSSAGGGSDGNRRRRRQHCPHQQNGSSAGGAGERRSRPGTGQLQPGRREPDGDRCRSDPRLFGSQLLSGRHHAVEFGRSP